MKFETNYTVDTVKWTKNISPIDKLSVINVMNAVDYDDYEGLDELNIPGDNSGAISLIFFVGDYVLKRSDFSEYQEFEFEGATLEDDGYTLEPFELEVQSDEEILLQLKGVPNCVELIGYFGDWVILERINASNLQDIELFGECSYTFNEKHVAQLVDFVERCLYRGIYPHDINEGSIFLLDDEKIKLIDFNLYQKFSYFEDEDITFNPENISYREMAKSIVRDCYPVKKMQKKNP